MEFDLKSVVLDDNDLETLSELVFNALNIWDSNNDKLIEYWNALPDDIKLDTLKWGIDDTQTGDDICKWLRNNYEQLP
jgi:hypothetical protein